MADDNPWTKKPKPPIPEFAKCDLIGWQAIADALGMSESSAKRQERNGLKVYRRGRGEKARVAAKTVEVVAWMNGEY